MIDNYFVIDFVYIFHNNSVFHLMITKWTFKIYMKNKLHLYFVTMLHFLPKTREIEL